MPHLRSQESYLSGVLLGSAFWGVGADGSILHPTSTAPKSAFTGGSRPDALAPNFLHGASGRAWTTGTIFDPNDPRNASIAHAARQLELRSFSHDIDYFRLQDDYAASLMTLGDAAAEQRPVKCTDAPLMTHAAASGTGCSSCATTRSRSSNTFSLFAAAPVRAALLMVAGAAERTRHSRLALR